MTEEPQEALIVNTATSFENQVDAVLSGADTTSSHLEVLKVTPPLLRMVGVPNLPILITSRHLKTVMQESGDDAANYHGLGAELVKRLPDMISDPVMIMDSLTHDDCVVVVTQAIDKENRPVIGAIKVNGYGNLNEFEINANILKSAYGKDNFSSFIQRNVEEGKMLYWNKEKSQELFETPGLQLPDNLNSLDFNTIIRKTNAFVNRDEQKTTEKKERNMRADTNNATEQSPRERVQQMRDEMVKTLLEYIEKNPTDWQSGWNNIAAGAPYNGKTNTAYRGLNALYLAFLGAIKGYKDSRWVTFNQAKELGASVKKGEKSSPVVFFEFYDRATKKSFNRLTVKDMTDEEKKAYIKENVYAVLKYSSVFNAEQCHNFPQRDENAFKMSEEERANQNVMVETIIGNSSAPVLYDGGSRAFYSPGEDKIHLPAIEAFDTMQDYYATALHEIAHSTGHESRLKRDLDGGFGSESYAKEELRAELACVFMQIEHGIRLEGKHITNHAAYLNSWLEAAKKDTSVFFKAAADAQKIADYVSENYLQSVSADVLEKESTETNETERNPMTDYLHIESNKEDVAQRALMVKAGLEENIKGWYTSTFPTDDAGKSINPQATFKDLQEQIKNADAVYSMLANDSVVKERAFVRLAELREVDYETVYSEWLGEPASPQWIKAVRTDVKSAETKLANARAQALLLAQETGEPYVTIEWTEKGNGFPNINAYDVMSLSTADKKLHALNDMAKNMEGYYKTKLHIDYVIEGQAVAYECCRFDIGSESGGLVQHIENFLKNDNLMLDAEEHKDLAKVVEYFKEHLAISEYLASPEKLAELSEEEQADVNKYVALGRDVLNSTVPFSDYVNHMPLTPEEVKNGRDAAHAAGLPFYEGTDEQFEEFEKAGGIVYDGNMSVEDYKRMQELQEQEGEREEKTAIKYYPINEEAARRAKHANSFDDYKEGSATAQYRASVDRAIALAEEQKKKVDPMYYGKIDGLVQTYARRLADNLNARYEIDARVPSILITGGGNFPVQKKLKQNAARDKNAQEWSEINALLDRIRSVGHGGISSDDPNSIQKLEAKLAGLEKTQETMKAINAYYRSNKKLDGCPILSAEQIKELKNDMERFPNLEGTPYASWQLSNNGAEIRRIKSRIEDLKKRQEVGFVGWTFEGGEAVANVEENRLQLIFDGKPDDETRAELRSNGFKWAPSQGAWQRQLTLNAYRASDNIKAIQPIGGEKPTKLQRAHAHRQERGSEPVQLELGPDIYRVGAVFSNNRPRELEIARADAKKYATETGEPYITIISSERGALADSVPWFEPGQILPTSEADEIFKNIDADFVKAGKTAEVKLSFDFKFEDKECTYNDFVYAFGAGNGSITEAFLAHAKQKMADTELAPEDRRLMQEYAIYLTQHAEFAEMQRKAIEDNLPMQEQLDMQSYVLVAREAVNTAIPFSMYSLPKLPSEYGREHEEKTESIPHYEINFSLNYSNEMLLTRELKKLGYERDNSLYEANQRSDSLNAEKGAESWLNAIRYVGADGKSFEGFYGRTYNGIMLEATNITGFTTTGLTLEEVNAISNVVREFDVNVGVNEIANAEKAQELTNYRYQIYTALQNENPNAFVFSRIGGEDLYQILGEKAKTVAEQYNLPLESRDIGEVNKIPTVSIRNTEAFPYIAKMREQGDVFLEVDGGWWQLEQRTVLHNNSDSPSPEQEVKEYAQTLKEFEISIGMPERSEEDYITQARNEIAELNGDRQEGEHEERLTLEEARNAMLDAHDKDIYHYAVKIENVPYTDPEDGYETEKPAQNIYVIDNQGRVELWRTEPFDAYIFESKLPYGYNGAREYERVEYEELERIAEQMHKPMQAFMDILRAETERKEEGQSRRSDSYYETRATDILNEHYNAGEGAFVRNLENPRYLNGTLYLDETYQGDKVLSLTKDAQNRNIAIIKRFNSYKVLVDYDTNASTWDRNYRHVFDTQQQAEEFRAREYPAKAPSAAPADIELKALGIIIQQKGQDIAEYVTFEGSNYLFRSEDLAVKYGGKVENGQIVITPKLESTYNRLRYEQMTASNSQLGQEYAAVKQVNPDSIVFYRIGDFYEVLGEDARRAAEVLDLTLTGRMLGDERIPMAGVPFHAIDEYAQKLAASGENVVVTGKDDGAKKIDAVKAPNLDNRMERRISAYAESLKKIDVELGYAARSDEYYRDRAMKEIAAYEQSDEYKQAVREDFPKDFIEDSPQDMREIPQNKPVQGNEGVREWYSIELPSDAVAGRYGENTMIKMPKGEFSNYVFFIPTKLIRILDDKKSIRIASDYKFRLNNDGRQVELTGQELQDSFAGKHIDKTYKRVAASRRFAQGLENLEKNVPAELKEIPAWCCYRTRWNPDKGKKDKFIISTIDGKWTSSKEPNKWVTFEAALKYARENNCEGLSLLLDKKYGITCIDLDKCYLNAETGEKKERATKLLEELKGTYIERSTSGNGIHIFLKDDILKGGIYNSTSMVKDEDPRGDLEVYDDKRIISMTGDMLSESNELNRAGSAATVYLRQELGEARSQKKYDAKFKPTTGLNLSDNELINWIQKSKQGSKFNDLMTGKGISGDRSADDAKLAHMLLYFSGGDKEQTFRIMRESGSYRPDKTDAYYRSTIDKMDAQIEEYAKRPNSQKGIGKPNGRAMPGKNSNQA